MLRILSYVGIGVTPSGPPRRLRPVQVVSLLDTVVVCKFVSGISFVLVDMAVFNGFRTDVVHC
jgi:hypothetical protein